MLQYQPKLYQIFPSAYGDDWWGGGNNRKVPSSILFNLYIALIITNIYQQSKDLQMECHPHPRNCLSVRFIDAQAGILLARRTLKLQNMHVELSQRSSCHIKGVVVKLEHL